MFKIKNNTNEKLFVIDEVGVGVHIDPNGEIEHEIPLRKDRGYDKILTISGAEQKKSEKPKDEKKQPEEVK